MTCEVAFPQIQLYVDQELTATEAADLEAHLLDCHGCRAIFEEMRAIVDDVRAAAPLYEVPDRSEIAVSELIRAKSRPFYSSTMPMLAAAAVLIIVCTAGVYLGYRQASGAFSKFAAASHIRYANGVVPLDVVSNQADLVSRWFGQRLPFHFKLPDYVEEPGNRKRYSLVGARLLQYRDNDVAYLAYKMDERPVSLLVASANQVTPTGGQTFRTGGIDFHFASDRGLRLITWTDRGLSYALVSDLNVTGAESCVICHGSAADRRKLEALPR
jgi:anti-sigma factor RsiW